MLFPAVSSWPTVCAVKLTATLTRSELRLVLAACVAACGVATMSTAFNFILAPIEDTFAASEFQMTLLREAPSIAALLMVFPAGVLGPRMGEKRFILLSAALFSAGTFLVAVAPVIEVATLGFLIANIGRTGMFIVGLAFMSRAITSADGRAAAFSFFYMVLPVVSIVMPVLAGVLVDGPGWRTVALACSLFGVASVVIVQVLIPAVPPSAGAGEMWTPALAGVALVFAVRALNAIAGDGLLSVDFLVPAGLGCVTLVVLAVLMRRLPMPSLSIGLLRHGALVILLVLLVLFGFANLWFYTTLAFEFIFGLSALQAAVALIPAQVAAILGALLGGKLILRVGVARAGLLLITATGLALWASAVIGSDSPLWLPMAIMSVYAVFVVGAGVPLTTAIMGSVAKGDEGDASAFRGAATNLGNALSVAVMTVIVAAAINFTLQQEYAAAGLDPETVAPIAKAIEAGSTTQDLSAQYAIPVTEVEDIDQMQVDAFVSGYRVQGVVGGFVTLVVGIAFYRVARREESARRA